MAIDVVFKITKRECIAAIGTEGIELCKSAMEEGVRPTTQGDTMSKGVANLRARHLCVAMGKVKTWSTNVVHDTILHNQQRRSGIPMLIIPRKENVIVYVSTVANNAVIATMDVALRKAVVMAFGKEMNTPPAIRCIVVWEVREHAAG